MMCTGIYAVHLPHFLSINTPNSSHHPSVVNISASSGTNTGPDTACPAQANFQYQQAAYREKGLKIALKPKAVCIHAYMCVVP